MLTPFDQDADEVLGEWFRDAGRRAAEQIVADDVSTADVTVTASVDCRYVGQGFELNVPLDGWCRVLSCNGFPSASAPHQQLYGHANRDEPIELVTLRVAAAGRTDARAHHPVARWTAVAGAQMHCWAVA